MHSAVTLPAEVSSIEKDCGASGVENSCTRRGTLRCETVTNFARLEELSADWQRLWESNRRAEIFQTFEWARAWWHSFGQDYALCSLIVHLDDRVVGIVPLVKRHGVIQFLGIPQADYCDILCTEEFVSEALSVAFSTLLTSVEGWRECRLQHLSPDSRTLQQYGDLDRKMRRHMHLLSSDYSATIVFDDKAREVLKPLLDKHHTRRRQNKLRKAGRVEFRHIENKSEAQQHLEQFFRHHTRRNTLIGRESSYARPESRQFLRNLAAELDPLSRLRFGILELNGRPLAWSLGFQVNGKFLLYQHTFDLDASDYTPGEVLLWNLLTYACNNITREFDFGSGDELYKTRFANRTRETFSLYLDRPTLIGKVRGFYREVEDFAKSRTRAAAQVVKSQRFLLRLWRSIRLRAIGTSARFRNAHRKGILLTYILDLVVRAFGDTIWSMRRLDVFGYENSTNLGRQFVSGACCDDGLDIKSCGFGELIDIAASHPQILSPTDLRNCRERIEAGDRVYIVRHNLQLALICWAWADANSHGLTRKDRAERSGLAMTIDECWPARAVDGAIYGKTLSFFLHDAIGRNAEPLVHCRLDQTVLRNELLASGFAPRYRVTRSKLFKWVSSEVSSTC